MAFGRELSKTPWEKHVPHNWDSYSSAHWRAKEAKARQGWRKALNSRQCEYHTERMIVFRDAATLMEQREAALRLEKQ